MSTTSLFKAGDQLFVRDRLERLAVFPIHFDNSRNLSESRFAKLTKREPEAQHLFVSQTIAVEAHRRQQEQFRQQLGPDYRADLDLIFANPDGTPLKPDSVSSAVSCFAGGSVCPRVPAYTHCVTSMDRSCWPMA
jgi:hypothetical protein